MREFDAQLLRLKQVLGVTSDQEVAKRLGLTKAAFSDRKARGAFPRDKLAVLVSEQPHLGIDVDFVVGGERSDYEEVRVKSLDAVLSHFQWTPDQMAHKIGLGDDRALGLRNALAMGGVARLRSREVRLLVDEYRVRRDFLLHGSEPMLRRGYADEDDVARIFAKLAEVERRLSALEARPEAKKMKSAPRASRREQGGVT